MKVGIVTGKFKPPHFGHYKSIIRAAEENDETHVFVSPREESPITGAMSMKILERYFSDREDIKGRLAEQSPVRSAYELIEKMGQSPEAENIHVTVYSGPSDLKRFERVEKYAGNIGSVDRVETERPEYAMGAGISGTLMRKFVMAGDKESFVKGIPPGMDADRIWEIVTGNEITEGGSWSIPAASFSQSTDPNIMPTGINVPVGGLPAHWTTSQPYSRCDLKTNPIADKYGRNPKSKRVKSFEEFCEGRWSNK